MNLNRIVTAHCWEQGCTETFEATYAAATAGRTYCERHSVLRPLYRFAALGLADEREGGK